LVEPAEPGHVALGGDLVHLGRQLANLGEVGRAQVRRGLGGGHALQDRHRDHLLLPGGGVERCDDRADVGLELHPAFGLEAPERFAHRNRADPELAGERVDVQPGLRAECAGVDPVAQNGVRPLLFVHTIRA
jgi:hypothetical protein